MCGISELLFLNISVFCILFLGPMVELQQEVWYFQLKSILVISKNKFCLKFLYTTFIATFFAEDVCGKEGFVQ